MQNALENLPIHYYNLFCYLIHAQIPKHNFCFIVFSLYLLLLCFFFLNALLNYSILKRLLHSMFKKIQKTKQPLSTSPEFLISLFFFSLVSSPLPFSLSSLPWKYIVFYSIQATYVCLILCQSTGCEHGRSHFCNCRPGSLISLWPQNTQKTWHIIYTNLCYLNMYSFLLLNINAN